MGAIEATQCSIDEETRQLWLFGDVDNSMAQLAIPTLGLWGRETANITVHLMSDGGCFQTGMAIYDAIRSTRGQVWTVAHGDVLSTAAAVFLAGDHRLVHPHTRLMFHRPFNTVEKGTLQDQDRARYQLTLCEEHLRHLWKELDLDEDLLGSVLSGRTEELWLDAPSTIQHGLAHAVVSGS